MSHVFGCECGTIRGRVEDPERTRRCVCYCADCQAFARYLGRGEMMLDPYGGTDIVHTTADNLRLSRGGDQLACMRLTSAGLLRWYAGCCGSPLGAMPASRRLPLVGLAGDALMVAGGSLDELFGPVRTVVHTASARGPGAPVGSGLPTAIGWLGLQLARALITGGYRRSPFRHAGTGEPVATPRVLNTRERAACRQAPSP